MTPADDSQHSSIGLHHVDVETALNETIGQLPCARAHLDDLRPVQWYKPVNGGVGIGGTPVVVRVGPGSEGGGA